MTPIAGVHGIWNHSYIDAERSLAAAVAAISSEWRGWLTEGLGLFDLAIPAPAELPVAYYADCLDSGIAMSDDPLLLDPLAQELFIEWADEIRIAEAPSEAPEPVPAGRLTVPLRQAATLFTERFGSGSVRIVSAAVAELSAYFDPAGAAVRQVVRDRLAETLRRYRPRVLVAHSLGSVVAYETLHAYPDLRLDLLLTLGSPLAMRRVVYDRLDPRPAWGKGARPPGVQNWANVADRGDFVAVPRRALPLRFDGVTKDIELRIHLIDPHRAQFYLRHREVLTLLLPYL